jgi:hypothetical protein
MSEQLSSTSQSADSISIDANDNLIRSVICDQADSIEKGWREGIQNSVDSDASKVELDFTHEYSLIEDNGSGVKLTEERGKELMTTMGASSKDKGSDEDIGCFGVGKGQLIAKGKTVFYSGGYAILFDIKNWGLESFQMKLFDVPSFLEDCGEDEWKELFEEHVGKGVYDGFGMFINHYEDEVPAEDSYHWRFHRENTEERFQFLESVNDTEVYVNGNQISDKHPLNHVNDTGVRKTISGDETEETYICITDSTGTEEPLEVYSNGIYVRDIEARGVEGVIVTSRNLSLNFARNEIKSGCPVWDEIQDRLDELRCEVFADSENDLNESAREFLAQQMLKDDEIRAEFGYEELFITATENRVSLNEIQTQHEIGKDVIGGDAGDTLEEALGVLVLGSEGEDDANDVLFEAEASNNTEFELPPLFNARDRAEDEGLQTTHEKLRDRELSDSQRKILGIAELLADELGCERSIEYGESDIAHAWTDGLTKIHITDSAASGTAWIEWVPSLWRTIVHEMAHRHSSKDDADHGSIFNREFRKELDEEHAEEALSAVMKEIQKSGLKDTAIKGMNQRGL